MPTNKPGIHYHAQRGKYSKRLKFPCNARPILSICQPCENVSPPAPCDRAYSLSPSQQRRAPRPNRKSRSFPVRHASYSVIIMIVIISYNHKAHLLFFCLSSITVSCGDASHAYCYSRLTSHHPRCRRYWTCSTCRQRASAHKRSAEEDTCGSSCPPTTSSPRPGISRSATASIPARSPGACGTTPPGRPASPTSKDPRSRPAAAAAATSRWGT